MEAAKLLLCENGEEDEEEEYIDMELTSSPSVQSREFEFQMCAAASGHPQTATSPADRLFHKGKLLPLYLLHPTTASAAAELEAEETYYSLPFISTTPLHSCNISPSESCRASCDLNSDGGGDFFFEWSNELNTFINHHHRHPATTKTSSWPKKLKNSILRHHKLKAYLKSIFLKTACSLDAAAKPQNPRGGELKNPKRKLETATYPTIAAIINNIEKEGVDDFNPNPNNTNNTQRRSFSSALIKRHSPTKCLSSSSSNSSSGSSSFSSNSNGGNNHLHDLQWLRRTTSATQIEGSIEAAIAHCKKSQSKKAENL